MGTLVMTRLDARMIHGQVVVGWIRLTQPTHILIIDDVIVKDPFMTQVLLLATPPLRKLRVISTQTAAEEWQKDQFGEGKFFALFQNVRCARDAYMAGFTFPNLLIGNIGMAPGKINVHGSISMDVNEAKLLQELTQNGCDVVLQAGGREVRSEDIRKKYFPNV